LANNTLTDSAANADCGLTPREVAKFLRVSPDRVRQWIQVGELRALNTATSRIGKPRFIILPEHLREFQRRREVSPPPKPVPRTKRRAGVIDFYPDTPRGGDA
jgi:excisionase family DNA binding protein